MAALGSCAVGASAETSCCRRGNGRGPTPAGSRYWGRSKPHFRLSKVCVYRPRKGAACRLTRCRCRVAERGAREGATDEWKRTGRKVQPPHSPHFANSLTRGRRPGAPGTRAALMTPHLRPPVLLPHALTYPKPNLPHERSASARVHAAGVAWSPDEARSQRGCQAAARARQEKPRYVQ